MGVSVEAIGKSASYAIYLACLILMAIVSGGKYDGMAAIAPDMAIEDGSGNRAPVAGLSLTLALLTQLSLAVRAKAPASRILCAMAALLAIALFLAV